MLCQTKRDMLQGRVCRCQDGAEFAQLLRKTSIEQSPEPTSGCRESPAVRKQANENGFNASHTAWAEVVLKWARLALDVVNEL